MPEISEFGLALVFSGPFGKLWHALRLEPGFMPLTDRGLQRCGKSTCMFCEEILVRSLSHGLHETTNGDLTYYLMLGIGTAVNRQRLYNLHTSFYLMLQSPDVFIG